MAYVMMKLVFGAGTVVMIWSPDAFQGGKSPSPIHSAGSWLTASES
jgi:hypothetical protein